MLARRTLSALSVVLFCAASGCTEASVVDRGTVVRDSAGVRIVEALAKSRFPAPWVVGDSALWSVGSPMGPGPAGYQFFHVVGATVLPNDEVLVASGTTNQLRFYDGEGRFLRALGGTGNGPGQFMHLRALGRCAEEGFSAFDGYWQLSTYDAAGTFSGRTFIFGSDRTPPYQLACDPHGHFLVLGRGPIVRPVGVFERRDHLLLRTLDGEVITDFGEHLVSEFMGSSRGDIPHPGGRATVFALHDDLVYVGTGERFEIELRSLDGSLKSLLRGPAVNLAVTDSLKASYLEWRLERAPQERRAALRQAITAWDWPPSYPAFTALQVDPAGVAWARAYSTRPVPFAPETWSLLDPEKGYIGDVVLAPGQSLFEVGRDYLLVLAYDESRMQRVLKLSLRRGGES